jgi:hypothetical protein
MFAIGIRVPLPEGSEQLVPGTSEHALAQEILYHRPNPGGLSTRAASEGGGNMARRTPARLAAQSPRRCTQIPTAAIRGYKRSWFSAIRYSSGENSLFSPFSLMAYDTWCIGHTVGQMSGWPTQTGLDGGWEVNTKLDGQGDWEDLGEVRREGWIWSRYTVWNS